MSRKLLDKLENRPFYASRTLLSSAIVAICRVFIDTLLYGYSADLKHFLLFLAWYLYLSIALAQLMAATQKLLWQKMFHPVSYALFLGLLPSLGLLFTGDRFEFDPLAFLSGASSMWFVGSQIPITETLVIWFAIAACLAYPLLQGRSISSALVSGIGSYIVFLLPMVALPKFYEWFLEGRAGFTDQNIGAFLTAMMIQAGLVTFVFINRNRLITKASRLLHSLPWFFAVLAGYAVAHPIAIEGWLLAFWILVMHICIVITNDYYDRKQDDGYRDVIQVSGEEVYLLNTMLAIFALTAVLFSAGLSALLFLYFLATLSYHHDTTRLKRICPVNYKTEGFVGGAAFAAGMIGLSQSYKMGHQDLLFIFLAFGGFSLVSMFKDYKDIDADDRADINTVYTVMRRRGVGVRSIHMVVIFVMLCCLSVPIILMGQFSVAFSLALAISAFSSAVSLWIIDNRANAVKIALLGLNLYLAVLVAGISSLKT